MIIVEYTLRAMLFAVIVMAAWAICAWGYEKWSGKKILTIKWAFFVFYIAALVHITVIRRGISWGQISGRSLDTVQLIPLVDLAVLAKQGFWPFTIIFVGNLIWFVPVGGFVFIMSGEKKSVKKAAGTGFLISLGIECLQWILAAGVSDVDDLLLNTLGAVIGYTLAAKLVKKPS